LTERLQLGPKRPGNLRFHNPSMLPPVYGRRAPLVRGFCGSVRAPSVVPRSPVCHTCHMAVTTGATTFVTGATGFIGTELVRVLIAAGHRVFGLVRSAEGAERVRRAGAVAVMGDLLRPGRWQDEAAADWVFH